MVSRAGPTAASVSAGLLSGCRLSDGLPVTQKVLRRIGYWDGPDASGGWPDVRGLVTQSPDPQQQAAVAAYLGSGTVFVAAAGASLCRICGCGNGSAELTDGEHFVWPEGLAHYVEAHDLRLPEEVVVVARRGLAAPVDPLDFEQKLFETGELAVDDDWWRAR